jgi:hypothetical protein
MYIENNITLTSALSDVILFTIFPGKRFWIKKVLSRSIMWYFRKTWYGGCALILERHKRCKIVWLTHWLFVAGVGVNVSKRLVGYNFASRSYFSVAWELHPMGISQFIFYYKNMIDRDATTWKIQGELRRF